MESILLEKLNNRKIIVYGTGYVACNFYKAMCNHDLQGQIWCFVRSGTIKNGEQFEGIPVYCFSDISIENDVLICLAVHEAIRDEIEHIVRQRTSQYLWIYPYLYELMLGVPKRKGVKLCVEKLLKGFQDDLRLGVRLSAIEEYEGKNDWGFDYYIKAQMLHCGEATAKQRLKQFERLISDWKKSGYRKESVVSLNRNYEIFDGLHRLSMAVYTNKKWIYGDIYPTDLTVGEIHRDGAILLERVLFEGGFSINEIKQIKELQEQYFRKYIKRDSI